MKKIALLKINSSYSHSNLGLGLIQSYVDNDNCIWKSFEGTINESLKEHLSKLLDFNPDVILVTFYLFNRQYLLSLLKRFKMINPDCIIIGGGPEFLGDNLLFLNEHNFIDIVIRGEGEIPVKEIFDSEEFASGFLTKETINEKNINGVCLNPTSGFHGSIFPILAERSLIQGPLCKHTNEYEDRCNIDTNVEISNPLSGDNDMSDEVVDLDSIPSPYINNMINWDRPFTQLETSRGCPNSCSFCTSSLSKKVRCFSLERVRDDLKCIQSHGLNDVRIIDRTFNLPEKRAISLLKLFREEFSDMKFHIEINPSSIGKGLRSELLLANSGQLHIEIGIQSLDSKTIDNINRKSSVDATLEGAMFLNNIKGLTVHADLIAGLPGCRLQSVLDSLNTLIDLKIEEIQLEILKLLPGTELASCRESFSIIASPETPYEVLKTADMTFDDIIFAEKLSRLIDCFYNYHPLQEVIYLAREHNHDFINIFCSWLNQEPRRKQREMFAIKSTSGIDEDLLSSTPSPQKRFKALLQFFDKNPKFQNDLIIETLTLSWFKCSFSPQHGPFPANPWKEDIPENAKLISGFKPKGRYKRIFSLQCSINRYLFAYHYPKNGKAEVSIWII